jgi:cell division protein FtsL
VSTLRQNNPPPKPILRWLAFAVALVALVALGVHRVTLEYQVLQAGYSKADAAKANRVLRERHQRIEVEIAATKDAARLEKLARGYHRMRYPGPTERIVVGSEEDR